MTHMSNVANLLPTFQSRGAFRYYRWRWDSDAILTAPPYLGSRQAAQTTTKFNGMALFLDTNTTVNKTWHAVLGWESIIPAVGGNSFGMPFYFSMIMNRSNELGTSAGENFQGIGWGDWFSVDTPWLTTYASDFSNNASLHLFYDHPNNLIKYSIYAQDGNPPVYTATTLQPPYSTDVHFLELGLEFNPVGNTLIIWINQKVSDVITPAQNPRLATMSSASNGHGPYCFWSNGAGPGRGASEAGFYDGHITYKYPVFT